MGFNATNEQLKAINSVGNTLVSAAAGSGKTAVLVERVVTALTNKENPVRADKLLVVTFTNAAANEMRSRIEKRLNEECRRNPDDATLNLQKHLLNSAKICTIDSFCIDLVRENFDKLGISPDFRIGENTTLNAINEKVAASIINRYLSEENEVFAELMNIVGSEVDEQNFLVFLLNIYTKVQHLPFPEIYYKKLSLFYEDGKFNESSVWAEYAFETAAEILGGIYSQLLNAKKSIETFEEFYLKYSATFDETLAKLSQLEKIAIEKNWDNFYHALNSFVLPTLPTKKRGEDEPFEVGDAKGYLRSVTESLKRLYTLFYADKGFIDLQYKYLYEPICLLSDILTELDNKILEEYLKHNILTFHNIEHFALQLLCHSDGEKIVINDGIEELISNYDAVMVDEFQDANNLQDTLFTILSDNGKKLFVVGDVKQSIYGFRGSNAENFFKKKNECISYEDDDENIAKKIILGMNFRCKKESCEFINYFFNLFMTKETGIIEYNDEERLIAGAVYPEVNTPSVEFDIIETNGTEYSGIEAEALRIADYIKQTMNEGEIIRVDNNTLRPARYSDFAILLRNAKTHGPVIAEILKKSGIPVNCTIENFTENTEISLALRLLSVIDNPQNDVDMLCVLLSPIFRFSAEELAILRCKQREGSLYSALITSANDGDTKCKEFLKKIEEYRRLSVTMPLPSFLSHILHDTDYIEIVSVLPEGTRKRANLQLLCRYAEQFSTDGINTVGAFSKRILSLNSDALKSAGTSGGNAVKIMSIHKSKGLQFPICIVSNLTAAFNTEHKRNSSVFTTDFGIGFEYYDEAVKQKLTSLPHEAISDSIGASAPEEELRLLYVAMTRTQDRLLFTSAINNIENKCKKLYLNLRYSDFKITKYMFSQYKSFADWLISACMLHPMGTDLRPYGCYVLPEETDSRFALRIIDGTALKLENFVAEEDVSVADEEIIRSAKENYSFKYPYEDILELESKASVSKLANSAENAKYAFSNEPSFMSYGGITASGKGTAMHKCMQYFDFSKANDIETELDRLYEWQYITEVERDNINTNSIKNFFESEIFLRMMKSPLLKREMRFLTEVNAKKLSPQLDDSFNEEKIIVQGAVDVCFTEPDGVVILDFKTDRVNSPEELKNAYSEQLNIYAAACEKIFSKPIKQKIIYSFALNKEIEI